MGRYVRAFRQFTGLITGKSVAAASGSALLGSTATERCLAWSVTLPKAAAILAASFVALEVSQDNGLCSMDEPFIAAVVLVTLAATRLGPPLSVYWTAGPPRRPAPF